MFYLESKLRNLDTQSGFFCKSAQGSKWEKKYWIAKILARKTSYAFHLKSQPFFNVNHIS